MYTAIVFLPLAGALIAGFFGRLLGEKASGVLTSLLLIIGIDQFLDMGRSATNVIGNSLATAVVAKWEGELKPPTEELRAPRLQPQAA